MAVESVFGARVRVRVVARGWGFCGCLRGFLVRRRGLVRAGFWGEGVLLLWGGAIVSL